MLTLADLVTQFELHAVCIHCQRMERLDLHELMSRLPSTSTVAEVRTRVCCRQCGRRTYDIRIVYVGIDGNARGFHYREHSVKAQSPSSSVPSSVSPNPDTPT
jgi:ribosomal protein L37E